MAPLDAERRSIPTHRIPRIIGDSIPMKEIFFVTYVMVDGWTGIAGDIEVIFFHLKNFFLVKIEKGREEAMDTGSICIDFRICCLPPPGTEHQRLQSVKQRDI
ncbi:CSC1-like protein At3g21620 isoform X1 [Miscanthus floridulus]|uniref:CSC1-like protein At3g21620 isoform X1 n=2 Tax=Miscanthus floridulus TaxID=154761 RepID=UPI003459CDD2